MKKIISVALALGLAGMSASAFAGNGFVRGELGRSDVNVKVDGVGSESDNDTAWAVRGGYWFNQNFAVEGFYGSFYDKSFSDGTDSANIKLSSIGLGIVGKKSFGTDGKGFYIDGRAGIARGKISVDSTIGDGSETSNDPYFGVGAGYDFSEKFGLSLNYGYQKGSGDGLDITAKTLMLGLEARF